MLPDFYVSSPTWIEINTRATQLCQTLERRTEQSVLKPAIVICAATLVFQITKHRPLECKLLVLSVGTLQELGLQFVSVFI